MAVGKGQRRCWASTEKRDFSTSCTCSRKAMKPGSKEAEHSRYDPESGLRMKRAQSLHRDPPLPVFEMSLPARKRSPVFK